MQNLNRPNLLQRIRAVFRPPGLLQPAQQQSSRMPDLERWTMPHRSVDMQDWTVARNMATNVLHPDRSRLMDLYDSILVDSHLASTMETRVLRVVRSRFRLMKDGEARPELLHHLETPWFEDFLRYVAEAAFRGHTLIELGQLARPGELKEVNRIDPRNVLPWSGIVVRRQGEETGYNYREAPLNAYLIEVGRPEDLGLLCDVGPVAIIKKYAVGSWSDYVHKYGIPPRWVKTNSRDARRFKQLETMMQNMLSSAYGVIEGDEEIQIMQTPGTDAHKVFNELISRMNSEISKRLLGQDGTTDNKDASGTYGSLKVLQGVAEDRHAADKASVGYVINQELLPRLTALGYPFAGVRFEWDGLRDLAPMELVDAVSKLGMVMDIDPEYIEERTGIRILGARRMPGEMGGNWPGWPGGGGNPPGNGRQGGGTGGAGGQREEEDDDDEDGDGITARWGHASEVCGICGGTKLIEAAAVPVIDEEVVADLIRKGWDGKRFAPRYFDALADIYQKAMDQAWNINGTAIAYDAPDHVARALMDANLFRFSQMKTMSALLDLNSLSKDAGTFSSFKKRVDESGVLTEYNTNQLRTEYTNVAQTGIQAERYHAMMRDSDVMPWGEYVTVGDGRVRPEHAALHGKRWPLDHQAWADIWPPNGWGCRCTVLPTDSGPNDALADRQWEQAKVELGNELSRMDRGGFKGNRAISGQVFDLNKAFLRKLRNEEGGAFKQGPAEAYDGKDMSYTKLIARATEELKDSTQGAGDWYARQANKDGLVVMQDWKGRPWTLDRETLDAHTDPGHPGYKPDTYQDRAALLPEVPRILSEPDEVWINQGRGRAVRYYFIRYYKGKAVTVRAELPPAAIKDARLRITSWFEAKPTNKSGRRANPEPDARTGTLVKKMPVSD